VINWSKFIRFYTANCGNAIQLYVMWCVTVIQGQQEVQLSQKGRAMPRVVEYFG